MPNIDFFKDIIGDPYAYATTWKEKTSNPVIGHFCSYTPIEFIIALGALPFRILSSKSDLSHADVHLQSYCCNLVQSSLEDALVGHLQFLDGTVFPHTCDTIQRLSDIWRLNIPKSFHLDVVLPVKLNTQSSYDYMVSVLIKFGSDLERLLGVEITDQRLHDAIVICNRNRHNLSELYRLKAQYPNRLSGSELHTVIRAAMVMDSYDLASHLDVLIDELSQDKNETLDNLKPILLAGGQCNTPDIYHIAEKHGAHVIWDDFCTGTRYFSGLVEQQNDPVQAIAKRYYNRIVCPAKHAGLQNRGDYLVQTVKDKNARGIIFIMQKFCDPHAFDYPYIKTMLDKESIPSLVIELENQFSIGSQIETRIQAFIEML